MSIPRSTIPINIKINQGSIVAKQGSSFDDLKISFKIDNPHHFKIEGFLIDHSHVDLNTIGLYKAMIKVHAISNSGQNIYCTSPIIIQVVDVDNTIQNTPIRKQVRQIKKGNLFSKVFSGVRDFFRN